MCNDLYSLRILYKDMCVCGSKDPDFQQLCLALDPKLQVGFSSVTGGCTIIGTMNTLND